MQDLPSQLEMFTVPSPCIGICQSGKNGYCVGCFRSREERLYWQKIDDATKRIIVKACYRRKKSADSRKAKANKLSDDVQQAQQHNLFK